MVLGLVLSKFLIEPERGASEFTAKFHVKNILAKLQVSDRTEAASAAFERGIIH